MINGVCREKLVDGGHDVRLWEKIIAHLDESEPIPNPEVVYVGGAVQVAHVERQEFDKRRRSQRQREARIKMSAEDGRIAR